MFIYIFIFVAIFLSKNKFTNIPEDSLIEQSMYMSISYNLVGNNNIVEKYLEELNSKIDSNKKNQIVKISSFYFREIQDYTDKTNTIYCITKGKDYNMLKKGDLGISTAIEESLKQNNQIDEKVLVYSKRLVSDFDREDFANTGALLSNATMEFLFGFFSILKAKFFQQQKFENTKSLHNSNHNKSIKLYSKCIEQNVRALYEDLDAKLNDTHYKKAMAYISEQIIYRVLKDNSTFDKIYEISKKTISFHIKQQDSNFCQVFIELFCEEAVLNQIRALYDFLTAEVKEEWHKYLSAVLSLKTFCLKKEITDKKTMIKKIVEFLFLADVEYVEKIKNQRKTCIDILKTIFEQRKIEYDKNTQGDSLDCIKVPKTANLIEIYCFIRLFFNDDYKKHLATQINQNFKQKLNIIGENFNQIKYKYLIYVFDTEISRLTPDQQRILFGPASKKGSNPKSESKSSNNFGLQEILDNEYAEIRVDTRIKTDVNIRNNRPDIFILDKKKNKITLIKVGITSLDSLQIVETEKLRKYDLLAHELGLIYKCSVEIIPYVMTWDGIVTKYHKSHLKRLEIPMNVEAYIQSIVLKKTVETISFDRRRGLESGLNAEESCERASMGVIMRAEMHEEPIPPLKEEKREED
ncbi:hypothetical protein CWI36_0277p0020, partial [Hamiltosporidium magnivora]